MILSRECWCDYKSINLYNCDFSSKSFKFIPSEMHAKSTKEYNSLSVLLLHALSFLFTYFRVIIFLDYIKLVNLNSEKIFLATIMK